MDERESTCDTIYLVQPKLETLDELEITYEYEDKNDVIPKVELLSTSPHLDHDLNEQTVEIVKPIKTELILSNDIVELQRQNEETEHGNVSEYVFMEQPTKVESETASDSSVDAACAPTLVDPLSVGVANSEHKVQVETYKKTLQNSVQDMNEDIEQGTTKVDVTKSNVSKSVQSKTNCLNNLMDQANTLIGKSLYTCDVCSKTFKSKKYLVIHKRTHSVTNLFPCKFCAFKSKYKISLSRHTRIHTGEKELKYQCVFCDYKCTTNSHLVQHMTTHSGEKPFSCGLCQFKTSRKANLIQHMKIHSGDKPYRCNVCKYKCATNNQLAVHMRTHTGEKPYTCELCQIKFTQKCHLVHHMTSHTGKKPFSCKVCHFKFTHKGSLVRHMKIHTGEKPYTCELCQFKCAQKGNLTRHTRTHHENNLEMTLH